MGVQLLHADGRTDGQTDVTKLTVAFCSFAKAPKNNGMLFWATAQYFLLLRLSDVVAVMVGNMLG